MTRSPSPCRVLLVDDNPSIHEDFRKILQTSEGLDPELAELESSLFADTAEPDRAEGRPCFEIHSAYSGEEALERVRRAKECGEPYALAFVDVRMPPGMDGIETLQHLWVKDPDLHAVVCTAYSDYSWLDMTLWLQETDRFLVLKKPFDPIEVLQLSHALTRKWELEGERRNQLADLESAVAERTEALERVNRELMDEVRARRQAEADLRELATHDALTGLPNRLMLQDRMSQAGARAARQGSKLAVLLLDLDGFKAVNDSISHAAGDELLREMADRLRATVRESDTVARMGGDEFVVLLEDLEEGGDAALVAERVLERCSEIVGVEGSEVRTPPSIGIALWPDDADDVDAILRSADMAMYEAKKRGGSSYSFFDARMREETFRHLQLRADLERALELGQLRLLHQPLYELHGGAIRGTEVLLRWEHPTQGMISPAEFIPEAERSGLIVPIGRWVLETACARLAQWRRCGAEDLRVAVNVSVRQLREPGFVDVVRAALERSELPPSALEIEITESAAFSEPELAERALAELAELGVRILIDDFGSGHSSLDRLKALPVHGLKIDRSFLRNISEDARDAALVVAIIAMARALDIEVIAEGVETPEQLESLRTMRSGDARALACDRVQGFLFSRPVRAEALEAMIFAGAPDRGLQLGIAG